MEHLQPTFFVVERPEGVEMVDRGLAGPTGRPSRCPRRRRRPPVVTEQSCRATMHCPHCHAEYRPGFEHCADCDVPLVHEATTDRDDDPPGRWTQLCTVSTDTEAALIQGCLESAGIPCTVESLVFHAEPVNLGALARVRLHVLDKHLDEARELLERRDDVPESVSPPRR